MSVSRSFRSGGGGDRHHQQQQHQQQQAQGWIKQPQQQHCQYKHYNALACVLNVRGNPFGILVVNSEGKSEVLEFNTQRWWPLAAWSSTTTTTTTNTTAGSSMASLGDQVYLLSCGNPSMMNPIMMMMNPNQQQQQDETIPHLYQFQFGNKTWKPMNSSQLNIPRWYSSMVAVKETQTLYVFGGRRPCSTKPGVCCFLESLASVESFQLLPRKEQDGETPSTTTTTTTTTTAGRWILHDIVPNELPSKDDGEDTNKEQPPQDEQQQQQQQESSSSLPQTVIPRMAPATVYVPERQLIYVMGGYTGQAWTTSVQVFSTQTNQFVADTKIPDMPFAVAFPKAVLLAWGSKYSSSDANRGTTNTTEEEDEENDDNDDNNNNNNIPEETEQQHKNSCNKLMTIIVMGMSTLNNYDNHNDNDDEEDRYAILQSLNVLTNTWKTLVKSPRSKMVLPYDGAAICQYGNELYSIGGREVTFTRIKDNSNNNTNSPAPNTRRNMRKASLNMITTTTTTPDNTNKDKNNNTATTTTTTTTITGASKQVLHWNVKTPRSIRDAFGSTATHHRRNSSGLTMGTGSRHSTASSYNNHRPLRRQPSRNNQQSSSAASYYSSADSSAGGYSAATGHNMPPSVLHFNGGGEEGADNYDDDATTGNNTFATSGVGSIASQMPSKVTEEVETIVLTEPMNYKDSQGLDGEYIGSVDAQTKRPHGKGQLTWDFTGDVYDGEWRHGVRQGHGRMVYGSGDVFEGFYQADMKHGRGTFQWRDGKQYEGLYQNDRCQDPHGTLTWKNGTMFVGHFNLGARTGKGVIRFPNGVRYQGSFVNSKYDGFGTCHFQDGKVYVGMWKKGKAHGKGKLTDIDGSVIHDGQWDMDAPVM